MQNNDFERRIEDAGDLAVIAERRSKETIPHDELLNLVRRNRIGSELDCDTDGW
jgi:hypothetical protein